MFINLKTVQNIRDLTGIKTEDGRKIKKNSFIRSADLHLLSKDELDILKNEYDLKTVIDFRSTRSFTNKHDLVDDSINLVHITALKYLEQQAYDKTIPLPPREFFKDIYKQLSLNPDGILTYKKFMETVIKTESGSILYHCTSGKDRTGIATSILLRVLGCSMETIYEEHMRTNEFADKLFDDFLKSYTPKDEKDYEFYYVYYITQKEFLDYYFELINEKYGSFDNYIKEAIGISEADKKYLQDKYLE